jgi:hypothetical protein
MPHMPLVLGLRQLYDDFLFCAAAAWSRTERTRSLRDYASLDHDRQSLAAFFGSSVIDAAGNADSSTVVCGRQKI